MSGWGTKAHRIGGVDPAAIPFAELFERQEPVVLEGLAANWPVVRAGREGAEQAAEYLCGFSNEAPVTVFTGPSEINGRFHYNADVSGFNFTSGRAPLSEILDGLLASVADGEAPAVYVGSTDIDHFLPGFREANDLALDHPDFAHKPVLASIWIGNRTTAAAHYDISHNLACCLVGERRFTLFPPDQIANLYPGPLEPTPGGQVVTMVDLREPDLERFPRFAEAMEAAIVAELQPGDVLYYPAMWWHQVDALAPFNMMANYWWNPVPAFIDTPQTTLLHALLSLRARPEGEKAAWREIFDYYIFGDGAEAGAHLPENARGPLGPVDEMAARRLRAQVMKRLNR
ncbi:cupin-like domain-containing protein [Alteraurantiacibacter aquimixticola]|uniref:Cupin-like domain-containing protein n=1 Tax=Alteraurantiacibacter aquimixticola TaxID=2489173 RepID=A0A4T3F2N7_9SPHN|nr:cupin-like domain-containing protein [Alteraurantiacibacter aquimixticola]TIX50971.1 cupin-like domain-containing protein [Alteraurantiacibacter aquimixticola]